MRSYLSQRKTEISDFLDRYLKERGDKLLKAGPWAAQVGDSLAAFSSRGKMIRGALVYLGAEVFSGEVPAGTVELAAVMELLQSFLLVHDDVMDKDELRRGEPALHAQYRTIGYDEKVSDPQWYGNSMAICAGDVAAFLALHLASTSPAPQGIRARLSELISEEIAFVGIAQMADVHNGMSSTELDPQEIIRTYRFKTGRYTFSLPLMVGAELAGAARPEREALARYGEAVGIIFQLKDDEIGLLGAPEVTGKPAASDIRENKKTYIRAAMLAEATSAERRRLSTLCGSDELREEDVEFVRELARSPGVRRRIDALVGEQLDEVKLAIESLTAARPEGKALLEELRDFNLERVR
jgi:geranylgeranyl diphosphate synthase type I